jgi:ligand-binding sensor domain-containing protein/serine phosphatase RsbU (regulator of sigma subunit)
MQKFFWILLFTTGLTTFAQKKELMFEQISSEQGLSSNWVRDIDQDSTGFVWLATNDALNRFDGSKVKVFRKDEQNPRSILGNYIRCIHVDKKGKLWVGFNGGLSQYNEASEDFTNYINNPNNPNSLPNNKVADICSDKNNRLWVLTREFGICYFEPDNYSFKKVSLPGFERGDFTKMICDSKNRLWIATNDVGVLCYEIETGNIKQYNFAKSKFSVVTLLEDSKGTIWVGARGFPLSVIEDGKLLEIKAVEAGDVVQSIEEDHEGKIWISLENNGVTIMEAGSKTKYTRIKHSEFIPTGLSHNSINTIFKDRENNIWLGTFAAGANLLKYPNNIFGHHFRKPGEMNSLSYNPVLSFLEDSKGLWIGTDNGGLNFLDYTTNQYKVFDKSNSQLKSNVILSITNANDNQLWIGTYLEGLYLLDKRTGACKRFAERSSIGSMVMDKDGKFLWIGTWGEGLLCMDLATQSIKKYESVPVDSKTLNDNFIFNVYQDKSGYIWCCTSTGLHLLIDKKEGVFKRFLKEEKNDKSIISNNVYNCFEDSKGRFWIGTSDGMCLMNRDSLNFTTISNGLIKNPNILAFEEDKFSNIWFCTFSGLYCFNPEKNSVLHYTKADGLQSNQFSRIALKTRSGELIFGGSNGFNRFYPEEILKRDNSGIVLLDAIYINNVPLLGELKERLGISPSTGLNQLTQLEVGSEQNNVQFSFATLNYFNANRLSFSYKLEGYEDSWRNADGQLFATYANLEPGEYTFMVKCWLHNDSVSGPIKQLKLIIYPPFYARWWFFLLIGIVLVYLLYKLYGVSIAALKKRQVLLEGRVKERTSQIEKQKQEIESLYLELEDSIDAAKTIQYNLLPSHSEIKKYFENYFLIYQPKHKVSGDFYWLKEFEDKIYFALIDCTGHGVPGAFLTMIASDKLDNLIGQNSITSVAGVLDKLNHEVIRTLRDPNEEFHMDGMDIALCEFDKRNFKFRFAGAKMSIVILQNNEFTITKGHRFSIGTHKVGTHLEFEISELTLQKGSQIYLFTDGFTDQLGGPNNQKFLLKRVLASLEETSALSIQEQGERMHEVFKQWKGDTPQLDDLTFWFIEV